MKRFLLFGALAAALVAAPAKRTFTGTVTGSLDEKTKAIQVESIAPSR